MNTDSSSVTQRGGNVIAALLLSLGIVTSSYVVASAYYKLKAAGNTIDVAGTAEQAVDSDTVKWSLTISRDATTTDLKAQAGVLASDLAEVQKYLEENKVTGQEITVNPAVFIPSCNRQEDVTYDMSGKRGCSGGISQYTLQQPLVVESKNVDAVAALARNATSGFIEKDIFLTTDGIEYYYNGLDSLRIQLLAAATENALERAREIAKQTNASLGPVQSVSTGVFQVTSENSVEFNDYGTYDTSSPRKRVTATLHATFILE